VERDDLGGVPVEEAGLGGVAASLAARRAVTASRSPLLSRSFVCRHSKNLGRFA
jgi:hypothetical protein